MVSKRRVRLSKKGRGTKKANKRVVKGGGVSQEEIKSFIETQLTTKRTVKDRSIEPVAWVWELLSGSEFFNNKYIPALAEMKDREGNPTYRKKNSLHREFPDIQKGMPEFYLMNDPDDPSHKSLISNKKEKFYEKNPQQFYDWWLSKQTYMDDKHIEKIEDYPLNDNETGTETIISIMEVVVINCMTHVVNSYIKYGKKENEDEESLLEKFLTSIEELYKPGSNYKSLHTFILAYSRWDSRRMMSEGVSFGLDGYNSVFLLSRINKMKLFYLPMSTAISFEKTLYLYSIPVLYFSIVNDIGHDFLFHSFGNMTHDMYHYMTLITIYSENPNINTKDLQSIYTLIKDFFIKVYEYGKEKKDKDNGQFNNICYILFSYLHEYDNCILTSVDEKYSLFFDIQKKPFCLPTIGYWDMAAYTNILSDEEALETLRIHNTRYFSDDNIICNKTHIKEIPIPTFIECNELINQWFTTTYNTDEKRGTAMSLNTETGLYESVYKIKEEEESEKMRQMREGRR